jgi:hypothetical protein
LPCSGTVAAWRIHHDGSLTDIGEFPLTIQVGGERLLKTNDGDVAMYEVSLGVLKLCEFGPGGSPAGIAGFCYPRDNADGQSKEMTG